MKSASRFGIPSLIFILALSLGCGRTGDGVKADAGAEILPPSIFSASVEYTNEPTLLHVDEHLRLGAMSSKNIQFPEARDHWFKVYEHYTDHPSVPDILFDIARSYQRQQMYDKAIAWFETVERRFPNSGKAGDSINYAASCYLRMRMYGPAIESYKRYLALHPTGNWASSAHLSIIDAHREAGMHDASIEWIGIMRTAFRETPDEMNAIHAKVRGDIFRERWDDALAGIGELETVGRFEGSKTSREELSYLRGLVLEQMGRITEARDAYRSVGGPSISYFGAMANRKLDIPESPEDFPAQLHPQYPVPFRDEVLKEARKHGIDPRFVYAVMKQESGFDPAATSSVGARGLLQFMFYTAERYKDAAGFPNLTPDELYKPEVNIALGCAYMATLLRDLGGIHEAVAAGYNAGEDSSLRWLERTKPRDPGLFTAEIAFNEAKAYVLKVMSNYYAYRVIYKEDLSKR